MEKNISKFLQFNDTNVLFTTENGITYIAIKPICQALNIDYSAQLKKLKTDAFMAPEYVVLRIQVGNLQARKYTCIPEQFIYGFIFSLNSSSQELLIFKKECYSLLYNYFHGVIGKRKQLLLGVAETQIQIDELKKKLNDNVSYKKMIELEEHKKSYNVEMKKIDKIVVTQTTLTLK